METKPSFFEILCQVSQNHKVTPGFTPPMGVSESLGDLIFNLQPSTWSPPLKKLKKVYPPTAKKPVQKTKIPEPPQLVLNFNELTSQEKEAFTLVNGYTKEALPETFSQSQTKRLFRKLAKLSHPDTQKLMNLDFVEIKNNFSLLFQAFEKKRLSPKGQI